MSHRGLLIFRRFTVTSLQALRITRSLSNSSRWSFQRTSGSKWGYGWGTLIGVAGGVTLIANLWERESDQRPALLPRLHAEEKKKEPQKNDPGVSLRELRFKDFASLTYKGELYMTATDFLESTTRDRPRDHYLQALDEKMVAQMMKGTPSCSQGSSNLFRTLGNNAIISYADYVFLLTALTKTTRQFEIAFRVFDDDSSGYISISEFRKVEQAITRGKGGSSEGTLPVTTLLVHLFGERGNRKLYVKEFVRFIENLQREVREIDFFKYSDGLPHLSKESFARILLRHTSVDIHPVLKRLHSISSVDSINFEQFEHFCQLLNALDDFAISMTIFTVAGKPITKEEFLRASHVCTGKPLDSSVADVIFGIFDTNGDGKLSYQEFLEVMQNWKVRSMKVRESREKGTWTQFKTCIKMEMSGR